MQRFTPSLVLDFTKGVLPAGLTFSRSSIATRINASGLIETVGNDVPRFDYDPVTLAPKGILIEESRTNIYLNSSLTSAGGGIVVSPSQPSPDGLANGVKYAPTSTNSFHYKRNAFTVSASTAYTFSVYMKASGLNTVSLGLTDNGTTYNANFNLVTGVIGTVSAGLAATIEPKGNGFYRCAITRTYTGTACIADIFPNSYGVYTGNDVDGITVWGAQFEAGSFPTSYIPTAASAVTRASESVSMSFGSWFSNTEGTILVDCFSTSGVVYKVFALSGGAGNAITPIYNNNSFELAQGGVNIISPPSLVGNLATQRRRSALAYKTNDFVYARSGSITHTISTGNVPPIGGLTLMTGGYTGNLYKIVYYPKRLPNSYLQSLTQ